MAGEAARFMGVSITDDSSLPLMDALERAEQQLRDKATECGDSGSMDSQDYNNHAADLVRALRDGVMRMMRVESRERRLVFVVENLYERPLRDKSLHGHAGGQVISDYDGYLDEWAKAAIASFRDPKSHNLYGYGELRFPCGLIELARAAAYAMPTTETDNYGNVTHHTLLPSRVLEAALERNGFSRSYNPKTGAWMYSPPEAE